NNFLKEFFYFYELQMEQFYQSALSRFKTKIDKTVIARVDPFDLFNTRTYYYFFTQTPPFYSKII
ncbi:hypothetical protein BpHYR1_010424, partial [Brachionus plicatilis]